MTFVVFRRGQLQTWKHSLWIKPMAAMSSRLPISASTNGCLYGHSNKLSDWKVRMKCCKKHLMQNTLRFHVSGLLIAIIPTIFSGCKVNSKGFQFRGKAISWQRQIEPAAKRTGRFSFVATLSRAVRVHLFLPRGNFPATSFSILCRKDFVIRCL